MRIITINENSYKLASFGSRALARLIDFVILIIPSLILAEVMVDQSAAELYPELAESNRNAAGMLVLWMYFSFMWASKGQSSVGQRLCGIKLLRTSGKRIGWGFATGRHFMGFLDLVVWFISLPMFFLTKNRQCLHDYVVGTVAVIKDPL